MNYPRLGISFHTGSPKANHTTGQVPPLGIDYG